MATPSHRGVDIISQRESDSSLGTKGLLGNRFPLTLCLLCHVYQTFIPPPRSRPLVRTIPPVSTADKRVIRRNAIIVFPEQPSPADEKNASALRLSKDTIPEAVTNSIRRLAETTLASVPPLKLNVQTAYSGDPRVSDFLGTSLVERDHENRAFAFLFEVIDDDPESVSEFDLTHLVTIQVSGGKQGWYGSAGLSSAIVETTAAKVPALIHDIMLDIAMFHSFPLLASRRADLDFCRKFSEVKVKYARQQELSTYYGPFRGDNIQYFSFAAHCRSKEGFDYGKFDQLWTEFVSGEFIQRELPEAPGGLEISVVDWILSIHKLSGQLSRRKIVNRVESLESGTYIFVTNVKRPKRMKDRMLIAQLMAKPHWVRNHWTVARFEELSRFSRALPFVTILKFRIP